ncbi:MAG: DUF2304 domain-containing protein [bacterium]
MFFRQKIFAIIVSFAIILFIIDMVRRRKLREEYSWLWILTGMVLVALVLWYDLLIFLSNLIGAVLPTTTLFIFGIIFLMLISLHYSIKISTLTDHVKKLTQELAILDQEIKEMRGNAPSLTS